jgi:chorismate mutase
MQAMLPNSPEFEAAEQAKLDTADLAVLLLERSDLNRQIRALVRERGKVIARIAAVKMKLGLHPVDRVDEDRPTETQLRLESLFTARELEESLTQ